MKPEKCVVIEDAGSGIEAARRAKMKSVGVLTHFNTKESLKDADLAVKNFSELSLDKLEALF